MIDVVIPVYRPDEKFDRLIEMLVKQKIRPESIIIMYTLTGVDENEIVRFERHINELLVKNGEPDDTFIRVYPIAKKDFSHGLTRNAGAAKGHSPYILMMTMDAVPADEYLTERMLNMIESTPDAGQCYARQKTDAAAPEYLRLTQRFNYPPESMVKSREDYGRLGIKTIFCSDVCCMYRRDVFEYIGGFEDIFFNEDMIFARKAIDAGYKVCYAADAVVYHYHKYSCKKQRKRNFDLAVTQKLYPRVFGDLSSVKEGRSMVKSIIKKLFKKGKIFQLIYFIFLSGNKFIGYKLGKNYRLFPKAWCRHMSATPSYWV